MELRIADAYYNGPLIDFYKEFPQKGPVELQIDRCSDYFAPYRIQSDQFLTYMFLDEKKIEGTATFVIREASIEGKPQNIAFGRDLRISSNRKAILNWVHHFLPVMEEVRKGFDCKYFFTALSHSDVQALNAFVRPRPLKRALPRYHLFRRFNLVSLHGYFPWARRPLPHLRIQKANASYLDALQYYVIKKSSQRELSTVWDSSSFKAKLKKWPNLKLEDFMIALDSKDNIIGCTAPWSSKGIQEFTPLSYNLTANNFRQFLKLSSSLGLGKVLPKSLIHDGKNKSLDFKYLCFLFADNEDIFESLLWQAFEETNSEEFLVYSQIRGEILYRRPINWISAKFPYSIYCLIEPEQKIPSFLSPYNQRSCEFEPFFA